MSDKSNKIVNVAIIATITILLLNPYGVVGRWLGSRYSDWRERQRVTDVWDGLVAAHSVLGSRGGDPANVIVEFADYDCPACRAVAPTVLELTRRGDAMVVVRHVTPDRADSSGREAARAAICAERQGRFAAAHEALMTDDTWLATEDWTGLAVSIEVADLAAFHTCLDDESTEQRLLGDEMFADTLRIPGTPTYVTRQGLHIGAGGFLAAVTAVAEIGAAETEEGTPARRLGSQSTFDSARDLDPVTATLIAANAAFFLPHEHLAIVDRTDIVFVDLRSRGVRAVGGLGNGPGEFNHITGAIRTAEGLASWDLLSQRISFFSADGEFLQSRTYDPRSFRHLLASPVAVHPEGDILFRDGDSPAGLVRGRTWDPAHYVALQKDGQLRTVVTAKGNELFYRNDPSQGVSESEHVIFGHRTFDGATADLLVVAQTDTGAINVLDWSGRLISSIPMPAGTKVAPHQVRLAIESVASARQQRLALANRLLTTQQMGGSRALPKFAMPNLPANEVAPAIDGLFVDFDERLWFREYRLPDQDSAVWRTWNIERPRQLFTLRTAGAVQLLDAKGDLVLVREEDALGVPRVFVKPIVPG